MSRKIPYKAIGLLALVALASALITGLLVNMYERKAEARRGPVRLVEVGEDDTDPAHWGINWPRQYDSYKRTAEATRTRFGGHGGSEALPAQKIERDPWLRRMFLGYAFSIRLPRPARPRLHALRPRANRAAIQASVRLLPTLPRLHHAPLPAAWRRRRHRGL